MKISGSFIIKDYLYIVCNDEKLTDDFTCNSITINGVKYAVSNFDIMHSINGRVQIVFRIPLPADIGNAKTLVTE